MVKQKILTACKKYTQLDQYFNENNTKCVLLICDLSMQYLLINKYFDELTTRTGIRVVRFSDFKPNPLYDSVVEGVRIFHENKCDMIVSVGGGSAMDVAKCIKVFSNMNQDENYLKQIIVPNDIKLLVVPTTAGTGSEATRYAVIYYNGEKQSVSDCSCIPSAVLLDASALKTLPPYQRKSTMMDAFCHSIESFWSVNSTDESRFYSKKAIQMIIANKDSYLANSNEGNANMLYASNLAGRAINITQTTAGHAMCYKLTSLYGIAHGHAASLCVSKIWPFMIEHPERCIDSRGMKYLIGIYSEIAEAMGCATVEDAVKRYNTILRSLELSVPEPNPGDYAILKKSVNPIRLKNHPIYLDEEAIDELYHQILQKRGCEGEG